MKAFICSVIFFIVIFIKSGYNYPNGAPITACPTMVPQHGVASQQCSSIYTIQSDKSQYYPNDTVLVTVNGSTSANVFKGVLLIAKTQNNGTIIGTWTIISSTIKTIACGNVANTGVTHTSNDAKVSVQALWQPPAVISDQNTIIRATIVQSYAVIYVDCFSISLTAKQTSGSLTSTVAPTLVTNANGTTNSIIPTTSSSTAIITTTTVPVTSQVGVNVAWTFSNGITLVTMQITNLQTSQWLALGLSPDGSMGGSHVFSCRYLADSTISLGRYINPGGYASPVPASTMNNPGGTFTVISQKLENGIASCVFTLSNFTNSKRRRRDVLSLSQSTAYYPLIAIGNLDTSNNMLKHTFRASLSPTVQLNQPATITYNVDPSDSSASPLVKAHGIVMIFAWILFASTGILVARHFKPAWSTRKIGGVAMWFVIHRTVMIGVVVLVIVGFVLILVYEKGTWVSRDEQLVFAHSIVGIIAICFALVQPIMALFRCKPDAQKRFIFNYAHRTVGLAALILSVVAIFLAMFFPSFNFKATGGWGVILAWTIWLPIIFFAFWFVDYYFKKNPPEQVPNEMSTLRKENEQQTTDNQAPPVINNEKQNRIKIALLAIHIVVALILSVAMAIVVGKVQLN